MKLISLKIQGFKNLDFWDNPIDFTESEGISIFIGNNGSGKSNVLEAISAIFYGLYSNHTEFQGFSQFELEYLINHRSPIKDSHGSQIITSSGDKILGYGDTNIVIKYDGKQITYYIKNQQNALRQIQYQTLLPLLPSQIIALYSGEETRLYEYYYLDEYNNFVENIVYGKKVLQDSISMNFIDKDFWNIALLTFAIYGEKFNYEEVLGVPSVKEVQFDFNGETLEMFSNKIDEDLYNFLKYTKDNVGLISIEKLRSVNTIGVYKDFYKMLLVAMLSKQNKYRILDSIYILFDNNGKFDAENLSEGQKKQILLYFVTHILADKNSIILLDEPDSYIHVGNKQRIKNMLEDYLSNLDGEGEIIMTTHSPTLMNKFDKKHLFYLENGKIDDRDKISILEQIAGDNMSYAKQQILLNTTKDIIIVEGKTDEIYIQTALEKLKEDNPQYRDLDFEFIPAGGADGIQLFMNKFKPKPGQKIMVFFDRDSDGRTGLETILGEKINNKDDFSYKIKDDYYISCYPKKPKFEENDFVIEDYFNVNLFTDFLLKDVKCFQDIPQKNKRKTAFAEECKNFDKSKFEGFKTLFDLIISIQNQQKSSS